MRIALELMRLTDMVCNLNGKTVGLPIEIETLQYIDPQPTTHTLRRKHC